MHIYIQCTRGGEMKFSYIIKLQRRKENIVYVNGGRIIAAVNI